MLDSYIITQYVSACADSAGIMVVWEKDGVPRTNGRTMFLPRFNAYATHEDKVRLIHFVKHETCHIKESDFTKLKAKNPQGILAFVNNLLEDHRIDYRNDSMYAGDKSNSEEYMRVYAKHVESTKLSDDAINYFIPLFKWDLDIRDDLWTRTADPFKIATPYAQEVYDKLSAGDYGSVLRNIRKIDDKSEAFDAVYALAKRIVDEVFDVRPESMEGKAAAARIKKASEKDGEGSDDTSKLKGVADVEIDGMPMPNPEHTDDRSMDGSTVESTATGSYTPTPADLIETFNFVTGNVAESISIDHKHAADYLTIAQDSENVSNQIRSKLQIISRDRYEYGKKSGKLNGSSIYRVGMKDAKGLNERIFKQKITNKVLDVSVQLLVDASGSMSGSKFEVASAASIILNKVLSNVLKIPTEILAFSDGRRHRMFIMKEFDKAVSDTSLAESFSTVSGHLCDNVDGESLVYGYSRIIKRKEKRKLMIVLSDGAPCGGHDRGDISAYTRSVIRNIEKTPVELLGIGLMHDTSKWYKNSAVIKNASSTSTALLSIITNKIIK